MKDDFAKDEIIPSVNDDSLDLAKQAYLQLKQKQIEKKELENKEKEIVLKKNQNNVKKNISKNDLNSDTLVENNHINFFKS